MSASMGPRAIPSKAFAVPWKDVDRWSVRSFYVSPWKWPCSKVKKLATALERRVEPVDRRAFDVQAQHLVRIRFNGEVEQRDVDGRLDLKGRLFFAYAGDIIYSKIDVRNGAIGILPSEIPIATVTSEFPVYRINRDLAVPEYVQLVFRTEHFRQLINTMVSGASGRKRVQPDDLEEMEIPLPSLDEQRVIVDRWRQARARIGAALQRAAELEGEILQNFLQGLGLVSPRKREKRKAFALGWDYLDRWGVAFNQQAAASLDLDAGRYPVAYLGDLVVDLENGWSPQCLNRPAEGEEWGVLKLGSVSFGAYNDRENKALPPTLQPIPRLEVRPGQVLISRANIPRLVGACALVDETLPRLMLSDKIFRVVLKDNSLIEPAYLAEVMKIPQLRRQLEAAATGTSPTMQNITKPALLALRLPLPPAAVQQELVAKTRAGRREIARLLESAERLGNNIKTEIEALIVGSENLQVGQNGRDS